MNCKNMKNKKIPNIINVIKLIKKGKFSEANKIILKYQNTHPNYKKIWNSLDRMASLSMSIENNYSIDFSSFENYIIDDKPSEDEIFDAIWYSDKYSIENSSDALEHYKTIGWKKYCDPSPMFSTTEYLNSEEGLFDYLLKTNSNPLSHYSLIGYTENRPIFHNPLIEYSKRYTPSSKTIFFDEINSDHNNKFKIAAIVHCYYPEIAEKILDKCLSLGFLVYGSLTEGVDNSELIEKYRDRVVFKKFINRGRDIAPFITGFKDEIASSDLCIHLHTKKSLHYGSERTDWMDYCLESLLSNVSEVIDIFETNENASIVFPEPPLFLLNQINWGHNFNRAKSILDRLGINLSKSDVLDFPVGSMFWFKPKHLSEIFDLPISTYHFENERGQVDGTLAHAIERILGVYCLKMGRKIIPVRCKKSKYFDLINYEKNNAEYLIKSSEPYKPNYNIALSHFYPELTPFGFEASDNNNYRVNLIIPTIDPKHIFGGISTALEFYEKLLNNLNFDGRIIVSDGESSIYSTVNFKNYSFYKLNLSDDNDRLQIVSCSERNLGSLKIRKNDIFISTAWWTANHMKAIEKYQTMCFGGVNKHIYFIQDYEPHFYAWSSKTVLALDTYKNNWINIYNSYLLEEYFAVKGMQKGFVLKPDLNASIKMALSEKVNTKKEKIILIYGRPFAERNCNELIIESISIFRKKFDPENKWKIISLGQSYTHELHSELDINVLGKISLSEYAGFLAKSFIGVSLMVSPHPSYPPYEMLAGGMFVYTNKYETKQKICESDMLTMGDGAPEDIADFLIASAEKYSVEKVYDFNATNINFGDGLNIARCAELVAKTYF